MKIFIIHPGIQHSYRLANALQKSFLFKKVYLFTSILFHEGKTPLIKSFKKRIKPIHKDVIIKNHYLYELLSKITRRLYNSVIINPNKQVHNNPIYFWQFIFGCLCLPSIWWHRKNLMLVTYETASWPITWFANKWKIPVVMDFPSISHEKAKELGINETNFGIAIKAKERQFIDYALFCSDFCRQSFAGLTSSQKDFVLYLGADARLENSENRELIEKNQVSSIKYQDDNGNIENSKIIKISFIANLEYRKGLDILLEALYSYTYPAFLEVHLIGKIKKEWVAEHMPNTIINQQLRTVYQPAMSQQALFSYLAQEQFDLNVQPSRFDSFAMVVPETMMQGIPNIVSLYVGAGEMLNNGVDGFVMEKLDAECLAKIINQYLNLEKIQKQQFKLEVRKSSNKMTWDLYNLSVKDAFVSILNTKKM